MANSESRDPDRVRSMFDGIASRYDLLNHLLSLNLDRRWRRAAAREVVPDPGHTVLDLCCGTGDLSLELAGRAGAGTVVCCDFSHSMLRLAGRKLRRKRVGQRCKLLEADGLRLPLRAGAVDAVTVAFGVRNFADMDAGLREIRRVIRPGGRLVVLEFSRPTARPLAAWYRWYLRFLVPRLGDGVAGRRGPYGYLARTIADFPDPPALAGRIREAGFAACGWSCLSGGIVAIHTAFKSPRPG